MNRPADRSRAAASTSGAGFLLAAACAATLCLCTNSHASSSAFVDGDLSEHSSRREVVATLAFVGDVLLHDTLQLQAHRNRSSGGFRTLWRQVEPALSAADLTYANLEGPVAEGVRCDGRLDPAPPPPSHARADCTADRTAVYTHFPFFNYPPYLLDDLKLAGVDIVSTGNNHALDRRPLGIDLTLDALDARELAHFGTRRSGATAQVPALSSIAYQGGTVTVAWVACSYTNNGLPDPHGQLAMCYDERGSANPILIAMVRRLAGSQPPDVVIVTPHWGHEFSSVPSARQRALAGELVAAGAHAVVGSHPHVLQPLELIEAGGNQAWVMYSLGNFVADQAGAATRASVVLYFDVTMGADGKYAVGDPRYLPMHMEDPRGRPSDRHALVPLDLERELSAPAAGSLALVLSILPDDMRVSLSTAVSLYRDRRSAEGAVGENQGDRPGAEGPTGCCGKAASLYM